MIPFLYKRSGMKIQVFTGTSMDHLITNFAGILVIFLLVKQWSLTRRYKHLPTGPPRLPLLGNILNWPLKKPWITFAQWAQTYGDIFYGNLGGISIIVVNSHETATVLLQDKSAKYSDRPSQHFLTRMVGWESAMLMLQDGHELNEQRRLLAPLLGTRKAIQLFDARIEVRVAQFVKRLVEDPDPDVLKHSQWLSGTTILDVTFGYKALDPGPDEFLALGRQVVNEFDKAVVPGAHWVDALPWLEHIPSWLPGTEFLAEAKSMCVNLM